MEKKKAKYEEEFKKTIVELYEKGKSTEELAREYGIPNTRTIYHWIEKYSKIKVSKGESTESISLDDYKKLQKKYKQIEEENEILKKVVAIFTKK